LDLSGSGLDVGQLIFINCNYLVVENYQLSNCSVGIYVENSHHNMFWNNSVINATTGISLYASINNTLSENNATLNMYGIYLHSSNNSTLSGNIAKHNTQHGIILHLSDNTTISENSVSYNNIYGIFLEFSNNNTLSGNIANYNNICGIFLDISNNNALSGNTEYNNANGIFLWGSKYNFLSGNIANNNSIGIYLTSSSNNNTLFGNIANYNTNGIYLTSSSNNILSGNIAYNNSNGIYLTSSSNNALSWNRVCNNSQTGISLEFSDNNILFGNIFLENPAYCSNSFDNSWDNGTLGNYWDDYKEKYPAATNNLTIWTTPYDIDANNIDYFPLVIIDSSEGENSNPTISHPLDKNFIVGSIGNYLEWTINDITIQDPTYIIYQDGIPIDNYSWIPGNPIRINLNALQFGIYNLSISVLDGLGGFVTDSVIVTVYFIPEAPILITYNQTITNDNIIVSWNVVSGATSYRLYVNGILNETTSSTSQQIRLYTNGTYLITVTALNQYGESISSVPISINVAIFPDSTGSDADGDSPQWNTQPWIWSLIGSGAGAFVAFGASEMMKRAKKKPRVL